MQIVVPVTDYIRRSILTANQDMVIRAGGIPARAPMGHYFFAYKGSNQSIPDNANTVIQLNATLHDFESDWDTGNYRYTSSGDELWLVIAHARLINGGSGGVFRLEIGFGAGSLVFQETTCHDATHETGLTVAAVIPLSSGEYTDLKVWQVTGGAKNVHGGSQYLNMIGYRLPTIIP